MQEIMNLEGTITLANSKMTKNKDMESLFGNMVMFMKESL